MPFVVKASAFRVTDFLPTFCYLPHHVPVGELRWQSFWLQGNPRAWGRDKALLPWPPTSDAQVPSTESFLSAAIRSLALSTDFVIVVAGQNEAALAPVAYANGASIVTNPDPSRGQFSSLQVGLREVLNHGRDAAFITLVDRPPANVATVPDAARFV